MTRVPKDKTKHQQLSLQIQSLLKKTVLQALPLGPCLQEVPTSRMPNAPEFIPRRKVLELIISIISIYK